MRSCRARRVAGYNIRFCHEARWHADRAGIGERHLRLLRWTCGCADYQYRRPASEATTGLAFSAREVCAVDGTSHGDAGPPGETAGLLVFADAAKPLGDLIVRHDLEAEPPVVGRVPRDVGVGGQRQGSEAVLLGPCSSGVQERLSEALSGVSGVHGDLLDMGVSIDHVEQEVGHGTIGVVGNDPGPIVCWKAASSVRDSGSSSATAAMSRSRNTAPAARSSCRIAGRSSQRAVRTIVTFSVISGSECSHGGNASNVVCTFSRPAQQGTPRCSTYTTCLQTRDIEGEIQSRSRREPGRIADERMAKSAFADSGGTSRWRFEGAARRGDSGALRDPG